MRDNMKFIELESERLRYRKFSTDDFGRVFDWLGNAENMKYRRGEPRSEAETIDYLNWAISGAEAEDCKTFEYAAVLKSDGSLIGSGCVFNIPDDPEIGWTLHRDHWRQGYGTEIGETMLRLAFGYLGLRRVIAGCNARNAGSYGIMEKIGMRREAHFVKAQMGSKALGSEWCDRYQYAILREEWEQRHKING